MSGGWAAAEWAGLKVEVSLTSGAYGCVWEIMLVFPAVSYCFVFPGGFNQILFISFYVMIWICSNGVPFLNSYAYFTRPLRRTNEERVVFIGFPNIFCYSIKVDIILVSIIQLPVLRTNIDNRLYTYCTTIIYRHLTLNQNPNGSVISTKLTQFRIQTYKVLREL